MSRRCSRLISDGNGNGNGSKRAERRLFGKRRMRPHGHTLDSCLEQIKECRTVLLSVAPLRTSGPNVENRTHWKHSKKNTRPETFERKHLPGSIRRDTPAENQSSKNVNNRADRVNYAMSDVQHLFAAGQRAHASAGFIALVAGHPVSRRFRSFTKCHRSPATFYIAFRFL